MQRAWDALTWRQRGQLASELAGGAMSAQQVRQVPCHAMPCSSLH